MEHICDRNLNLIIFRFIHSEGSVILFFKQKKNSPRILKLIYKFIQGLFLQKTSLYVQHSKKENTFLAVSKSHNINIKNKYTCTL